MYALVRFRVADPERWRTVLGERATVRAEHGCRGGTVFARHDSERRPVLLAEWDDAASAEAYFDGEDFESAMRDAGVRSKPEVTLLEYVDDLDVVGDPGGAGDGGGGDEADVAGDGDDEGNGDATGG